jgi:hypothetical protein
MHERRKEPQTGLSAATSQHTRIENAKPFDAAL